MAKAKLMGILNVTPDSFYDGGRYSSKDKSIEQGRLLLSQGADILDIGGESSRPNALPVTLEEELQRVIPIITVLSYEATAMISIDTTKPEVAKAALEAGATMLNDISGFVNPEMRRLAATSGVPLCLMHMQGNPKTMQLNPSYPMGIINEMLDWFKTRIQLLLDSGIKAHQITIDPGIGFGKTIADNIQIMQNLRQLKALGFPLLVGVSRKSFMSKTLNKGPDKLLAPTLAMNTVALLNGADIIRVHDVAENRAIIDMMTAYMNQDLLK
jgi:dihydropteroate synthase